MEIYVQFIITYIQTNIEQLYTHGIYEPMNNCEIMFKLPRKKWKYSLTQLIIPNHLQKRIFSIWKHIKWPEENGDIY